jgi:flagellar protein FlaG
MTDINSLSAQGLRSAATNTHVRFQGQVNVDAATAQTASTGRSGGNVMPPSMSAENAARHERAIAESRESLDRAVAHLNDYVQSIQRDLHFFVDKATGRSVVTVVDQSTQEVVRQIPSEVVLRLARNLKAQQEAQPAPSEGLGLIDTRI